MQCMHYWVSGRVQGVWFRASTCEEAQRLGLRGWARNLPDGRVEVLACGAQQSLARLEEWLWEGPPLAQVNAVEAQTGECDPPAGFEAR